jgi:hypothetical protein
MSIVSYKQRGNFGKSSYRGNSSGYLYRDLFSWTRPELVVDPCVGSGTSLDVARSMGIEAVGLDLHSGFNMLRDSILGAVGRESDICVSHFPYHDMVRYSGEQYPETMGPEYYKDDLSRCLSVEDFIEKSIVCLMNQREAVKPGGYYATLIGDQRKNGEYRSFQAEYIARMPDELASVVIKAQHNVMSDSRDYGGRFAKKGLPRILHEYLVIWQKPESTSILITLGDMARKAYSRLWSTWKAVVRHALIQLGGRAQLKDIYAFVQNVASDRIQENQHWQAKIRQTLQRAECFSSEERGVWQLA